jgi:predicted DNA-binding transcriptional regulator YafY
MPRNKEALIRYRVINRCLIEKTYVTKQELKEACERALDIYPIGERTIDADIHAMRYDERLGYNAPIKIDRINKKYYYDDTNYSIDNIPLNDEELDSIVFASKLLEQFKGVEVFKTFTGSVQKIVEAINIYRHTTEDSYRDFIEFEKVDEQKGTEYIEPIMEALRNRSVLRLKYKRFNAPQPVSHVIHPCLLKEYRNRWYLIGYQDKYKEIRTYSLDRIDEIAVENNIKYIDTGFDARKYYENVIGISVLNEEPVEIHIAYTELQAQYVITQPLHHSQELVLEDKDRYVFKYFLVPNFEFYQQILGWGEEVEIIYPNDVRDKIHLIAQEIIQKSSREK